LLEELRTAGHLRSAGVTPPHRSYVPIRHPLAFGRLPGNTGYTTYLSPRISPRGEEGFSSFLACPCHRAAASTPPERAAAATKMRRPVLPSASRYGLGLRNYWISRLLMRSQSLRPGDSLTTPWVALSVGFRSLFSLLSATQATGILVSSLAGLTPAEHASLCWTHIATPSIPQRFDPCWPTLGSSLCACRRDRPI
jgi:hypothetical protein